MAKQFETFEVVCDAPPYCVVKVCTLIGIEAPEDVRWRRMSQHVSETVQERRLTPSTPALAAWFFNRAPQDYCTCGERIPKLEMFTFTFSTGEESCYLLGQCRRCRTVFWDDA